MGSMEYEHEENPYLFLIENLCDGTLCKSEDLMTRFPTEDSRTLYRMELILEPSESEKNVNEKNEEAIGVWSVQLGPVLSHYIDSRINDGANREVEVAMAQAAVQHSLFHMVLGEQMKRSPENFMMVHIGDDDDIEGN